MPTGIQIDSVLTLDTRSAEQQLKEIAKGVKPVTLPINFSSEAIEEKVAELKKVTFDWSVTPDIEFNAIAQLKKIVGEIQSDSQFKIIPDVGFVEINQLKQDIEDIRNRSTIDIVADVNFAQVEKLKQDFSNLRNQSELRLKLASDADNLVSIRQNNKKTTDELVSNAKQQTQKLENVIEEQRNTQRTIEAESAVSLGNMIKGQFASFGLETIKQVGISEFNIDPDFLKKKLIDIIPGAKILTDEIKENIKKNIQDNEFGQAIGKLKQNLLIDFADATVGVTNFSELLQKFKQLSVDNSLNEFRKEIIETTSKIQSASNYLEGLADIGIELRDIKNQILFSRGSQYATRRIIDQVEKPIAKRKDLIQTTRLPNVVQRADEILTQEKVEVLQNAEAIASATDNVLNILTDEVEELFLIIGGHTDDLEAGIKIAEKLNTQFRKRKKLDTKKAVGIKGKDTVFVYDEQERHKFSQIFSVARPNIRGFSRDAEEIAAQAVAALIKNPNLKIKVLGESGGGLPAQEAVEILNKLGFKDRVSGVGSGTPQFKARTTNPENFNAYLGVNDREWVGRYVMQSLAKYGWLSDEVTRKNPKVSQSMKGLSGHMLPSYLQTAEVRDFVYGDKKGKKQQNASVEEVKKIQEDVIKNIQKGNFEQAQNIFDEFKQSKRITAKNKSFFEQIEKSLNDLQKNIDDGLIEYLTEIDKNIKTLNRDSDIAKKEGNIDYFSESKKYLDHVKVRLLLTKNYASKLTKEYIGSIERQIKDFLNSIPESSNPEIVKGNFEASRLNQELPAIEQLEEPKEAIEYLEGWKTYLESQLSILNSLDDDEKGKNQVIAILSEQKSTVDKLLAVKQAQSDLKAIQQSLQSTGYEIENAKKQGDTQFLSNLKQDLLKIKKEVSEVSPLGDELTKEYIGSIEKQIKDFLNSIPELSNPEIVKGNFEASRLNQELPAIEQLEEPKEAIEYLEGWKTYLESQLSILNSLDDDEKGKNQVIAILSEQKSTVDKLLAVKQAQSGLNTVEEIDLQQDLPPVEQVKKPSKESLKSAIAKYKDTIIAYRKEIEQKIFDGTVTDAELEAGKELVRRSQALSEELKEQGGFSREVKSLSGVTDTLNRKISTVDRTITEDVGKDVVEGILKGTNEKLAVVFAQGEALGIELLEGFKKKLEIKSPSGKFSDEMSDVAAGIVEGRKKQRARIRQAGEDIGQDLFDGSQLSLSEYKQLLSSLEGMIQNFDISDSSEEMKKLEKSIQETADKIAAFQEIADSHRIKVEPDHNSLHKYKELLFKLETSIQNFDISDTSEEMKKLERVIEDTADEIAAFLEVSNNGKLGNLGNNISDVAAGIVNRKLQERNPAIQGNRNLEQDSLKRAKISLTEYKELLFKLETSIQNFDISDTSEEMKKLERVIEDTADEIAAFLEVSNNGKLGNLGNNISDVAAGIVNRKLQERKPNIQAGDELDEFLRNIPDDINLDLEVDDKELNEFLRNIPDDIELEIETDTGNSNQQLSRLDRNLERVRRTATNTLRALVGFGVLRITSSLGNYFEDIIRQSIETQIRFEQLETSINFVAGSAEEGAKSLEFVRQTARKLKIDLEVATNSYKQLAAAANNTTLENETSRIFSSITQASRVFGLSAEQTEGAILALSQMISKGTVQAEELRGQLGERIPGSFQIAARAMGVTTQELGKLLETGQVTAEEFLPKFARQLASETKGGVTGAINTTGAAIQELRGAYTQLQLEIAETTKPAQLALYLTLADNIRLASENLNILIPAAKILTSTLIVLFLPAIVSLGNLLKGLILANFGKLLTLLNANTASLGAMAKTTKILSAAFKTFVIIEVLSQAIALTQNLTTINQEAKDAVKDLDEAYQEFVKNLSKNQPENKLLQEDIVEGNIKKAKDELGKGAKFLDAATDNFIGRSAKKGIANIPLLLPFRFDADRTFADAAIEDAEAKAIEAISKANANLSNISIDIGTDIEEIETDDLQNAVDAINSNIANLEVLAPTTIETLNGQREAIARQNDELKKYNDELKRRDGLEKTFAKVDVVRKKAVEDATRIESEALNKIDREILESGDLKRDVELEKLTATDNRITAELEAERQALIELESIVKERSLNKASEEIAKLQKQFEGGTISAKALADGTKEINDRLIGIDSDSGFLKGLSKKEIETFTKRRDQIVELERNAVESKISIATEEVEQKIVEYDRYLEEIENRRQKAEDLTIESEKRRLIEIQQLINDDVISTEQAEELKANATYDRIKDELDEEKHKLYKLKRFKTDSVEAQEKADNDIKASRQKVLDLTLQLLQEEQQAEERTTNAIAQSRDNLFAKMEQRLSRIQQLYNLQSQLEGDRTTSQDKLADLELSRLKQALAIRQQLDSGDLDKHERKTALKQLYSLGIKGRTDEISLLNKIESKEEKIAKQKMANLERQHELARANLEIENQRFELETRKAKLEADREQRQAEQKVLDADTAITEAERAVANATTEEELDIANQQLDSAYELYDIAGLSLKLANQEQEAADQQLDNLDAIIAKKRENLELSQAIAKAEQEGISLDELAERDKAFNQAFEGEDRRKAETLTGAKQDELLKPYLTNQEKIDSQTEKKVNKLIEQQKQRLGEKFTSEDESALREQETARIKARLTRDFNRQENKEENKVTRSLFGSPGFSIEAPPEILKAIKSGKPFVVPVIPEIKTDIPLEVKTIGSTQGNLGSGDLILNTLKNIEQKFKQPSVINVTNDNQFVNQYQKNDMDEVLRRTRSDLVEVIKTVGVDF